MIFNLYVQTHEFLFMVSVLSFALYRISYKYQENAFNFSNVFIQIFLVWHIPVWKKKTTTNNPTPKKSQAKSKKPKPKEKPPTKTHKWTPPNKHLFQKTISMRLKRVARTMNTNEPISSKGATFSNFLTFWNS